MAEPLTNWAANVTSFAMSPADVQKHCARLADCRDFARALDPGGKFRNRFLEAYVRG